MSDFPIGETIALLFGMFAVFLNKQLGKMFYKMHTTLFGENHELWEFRMVLYITGGFFLITGGYRLFVR
jgi:hypothetical protein